MSKIACGNTRSSCHQDVIGYNEECGEYSGNLSGRGEGARKFILVQRERRIQAMQQTDSGKAVFEVQLAEVNN